METQYQYLINLEESLLEMILTITSGPSAKIIFATTLQGIYNVFLVYIVKDLSDIKIIKDI